MPCLFDEKRIFRYVLTREWDESLPRCCFIGLNPSTADENQDDPTIRKCIKYAKTWGGFGGLLMLNLFAYRATKPKDMFDARKRGVDIIGGKRNYFEAMRGYIETYNAKMVVAAWGRHAGGRGFEAIRNLRDLRYLDLNNDQSPKHPLYLLDSLKPQVFGGVSQQDQAQPF